MSHNSQLSLFDSPELPDDPVAPPNAPVPISPPVAATPAVPSSPFDVIRRTKTGPDGREVEYWSARDAMEFLGYEKWQKFEDAINRAMLACANQDQSVDAHFQRIDNLIFTRSGNNQKGSGRKGLDWHVSRYGMSLIAINSSVTKTKVAMAQRYFAIQTRRAEVLLPPIAVAPQPAPEPVRQVRPDDVHLHEWMIRGLALQPHKMAIYTKFSPAHWTVFTAAQSDMLVAADVFRNHGMPLSRTDSMDGSVGKMWAKYRRENGYPPCAGTAKLLIPPDDMDVDVAVYAPGERDAFLLWLHDHYYPVHMVAYVDRKPEWRPCGKLTCGSAAENASNILACRPAAIGEPRREQLRARGGFVPTAAALPPRPPRKRLGNRGRG